MAIASLIRNEIAKRLPGIVFTESQTQYCKLPVILIETPTVRSIDTESHYAKQITLTITVMLKTKKDALVEAEKLVEKIEHQMKQPIPGTLSHQWVETTYEHNMTQEQPLVIAKLFFEIMVAV